MATVTVALEALSADATTWRKTSYVLGDASVTAATISLTEDQLSWASCGGLSATYNELQAHVAELLKEGAEETHKTAHNLYEVRRIYESSDKHAIKALHGVWDVRK